MRRLIILVVGVLLAMSSSAIATPPAAASKATTERVSDAGGTGRRAPTRRRQRTGLGRKTTPIIGSPLCLAWRVGRVPIFRGSWVLNRRSDVLCRLVVVLLLVIGARAVSAGLAQAARLPVGHLAATPTGPVAVPVVACPISPSDLAGVSAPVPDVPGTLALPASAVPPSDAIVYGTGVPGGSVDFALGPAKSSCGATLGADGAFAMNIRPSGSGRTALTSVFSPGGAGPSVDLACAYIPAVHTADVAFRNGDYCPTRPATDAVTQIGTGDPSYLAAIVITPPGTTDPQLTTSGVQMQSTNAVFVAQMNGNNQVSAQQAECTLPASDLTLCTAALTFFVNHSLLEGSSRALSAVGAAVGHLVAPVGRIAVLGDSYASGEGTYNNGSDPAVPSVDYYPETATNDNKCHRSPKAYAPQLGVAEADFVACSGATIDAMQHPNNNERSQLDVLDSSVRTVILSVGGDDAHFAYVLTQCTSIPWPGLDHSYSDCQKAVDTARGDIPGIMSRLKSLYTAIEDDKHTNGAHLIVVGYPRIFPSGGHYFGCNHIDVPSQLLLNDAGDYLDDQIQATVAQVPNATFVDVRPLFSGHEICGSTQGSYFNDLQTNELCNKDHTLGLGCNCPDNYLSGSGPACSQSYHPNVAAYKAEYELLKGILAGSFPNSSPTPASAQPPLAADCYDINHGVNNSSGIDTEPMAHYCADALTTVGYHANAHTNSTAADALAASPNDAVFYAASYSGSDCPGEWNSDKTVVVDPNQSTGASIIMPGNSGDTTFLTGPRDIGAGGDDNCFADFASSSLASKWATASVIGHADLVVLQASDTLKPTFTATDGSQLVSIGQQAFTAGAKVVVGFTDEIQFEGNYGQQGFDYGINSPYRPTGDIWAHTFWAALGSGVPVSYAAEDATAQETFFSGGDGYLNWRILQQPDAPATLPTILGASQ